MDSARQIASLSPSTVRGANQLINRVSNAGAAEHFAGEREIIFTKIINPNQVEAITANFETREPQFRDVGKAICPAHSDDARISRILTERCPGVCRRARCYRVDS
jgi:hypothetical protein